MKTVRVILGLVLAFSASTASAFYNEQQREVYRTCLAAHGYNPSDFHTFNHFSKVATCVNKYQAGKLEEEVIRLKMWMKENPHYGGPNWQWETYDPNYKCVQRPNGTTICRKPYYVN